MSKLADVPTIDISLLFGDDREAKQHVAVKIDKACRDLGFFYATGHQIDVERLQQKVNDFHSALTEHEKFRIAINAYNAGNSHVRNGYYMAVADKKAVESFCYLNPSFTNSHPMIRAHAALHEVNWWPDELVYPTFRSYFERYFCEVLKLSRVLLRGFALGLGRNEDYFDPHVTLADTLSAVSLIHYPYLENYPPLKQALDGTKLSFEGHVDVSIITVLFQTPVSNLQVETPEGWLDLPTSGSDFLVNCGTFMAHLTNNYYRAPLHRVKWVNAERLSIPFFVHGANNTELAPFYPDSRAESCGNKGILYGEYLRHGLDALIKKNGQT